MRLEIHLPRFVDGMFGLCQTQAVCAVMGVAVMAQALARSGPKICAK